MLKPCLAAAAAPAVKARRAARRGRAGVLTRWHLVGAGVAAAPFETLATVARVGHGCAAKAAGAAPVVIDRVRQR